MTNKAFRRYLMALLAGLTCSLGTAHGQRSSLVIDVQNIQLGEGNVLVALYDSENNFLKHHCIGKIAKAATQEMSFVFDDIVPGEYAVSVIHDQNANGRLDTNFLGIPKEGYGFTNGVQGAFGPPTFEKAKFVLNGGDEKIVVPLRYL